MNEPTNYPPIKIINETRTLRVSMSKWWPPPQGIDNCQLAGVEMLATTDTQRNATVNAARTCARACTPPMMIRYGKEWVSVKKRNPNTVIVT